MTTPSEYARNATAALHRVLHISPDHFDGDGTAAVIEDIIRNATRERERSPPPVEGGEGGGTGTGEAC